MKKSRKKKSKISWAVDIFLLVFVVFLVVMFIRGKIKQKEDGEEMYGAYSYEVVNGEVVINEYLGSETEIEIPSEIDEMKVVSIAKDAFKGNEYIETLVVPSSIRAIGIASFQGCIRLKTVEIAEGTELICSYAFRNCKSLESIIIPDTVTDIGYGAFLDAGDVTLHCESESVAEEFALKYELKYDNN